jgi:hypothetical protein
MDFPLKLAYDRLPADATEVQTTVALLRHAVTQKYPEGLPKTELRLWDRIDRALDTQADHVELTTAQFTFLRDAVHGARWPVPWARLATTFLDVLDEVERTL